MDIDISLKHVAEMMSARGASDEDVSRFLEEASDVPKNRFYSDSVVLHIGTSICVIYILNKNVKDFWKTIKDISAGELVEEYECNNFILVTMDKPTTANSNAIELMNTELGKLGGKMENFLMKELRYNPARHILVPKHEKITDDDVKGLLEKHMLKSPFQLPHISKSDIMARYLGLRHGDVVRITRINDTSGSYFYYRCCI